MAQIARTSTTDDFDKMAVAAYSMNETNDCAVKAVAIVCGVGYEEAHTYLKSIGREDRKGTRVLLIDCAIRHFGKTSTLVNKRHFIDRYPKSHRSLNSVTSHHPDRFHSVWADGETYLMYVSGGNHVLAIVDGVNHDWTKGTAKIACRIYRITNA